MKKINLKLILTAVFVMFFTCVSTAQSFVNEDFARKIGENFISNKTRSEKVQLNLFHVEQGADNQPNLYIYNVEGGGFVIVSASKNVRPVLAYSVRNSYEGEIPLTAQYFIDSYNANIEYCDAEGIKMNDEVEMEWRLLENNELPAAKNANTVEPLISTTWNQDCYYNYYAPQAWGGPCNKCYAGCVACAMSQIMKYWNHPAQGHGSHSYTHGTYGLLSANFGNTTYQWDDMPNYIWSENDAIATLMYHCGVSVDMNFSPNGSGAQSRDVETALRQYFGYCAATFRERSKYTEEEWIALLKSELDKSQPMYFSGDNGSSGHAIVCDGYDSNDYFSFNLGWSGSGNDYYSINDVAGFNNNEAIVMDIIPLEINSDENGIIYVSPDGTGDGSSWENATPYIEYAASRATDVSKMVWVKAGTYYGDIDNENGAFNIYKNNRIYGGFAGNETPDFNLDDRDFEANPTILDGQNSRRVLYQVDHFTNAEYSIWDGFVIQNGSWGSGAGAYLCSNTRFKNCEFLNNNSNGFGGAAYIISAFYENASVRFDNCVFDGNSGSLGGAVMDMMGATIINCRFSNNSALTKGGAYYVYSNKESKIVNSIFDNNTAKLGGAMYNKGKITMINCDVVNNSSTENGGGMFNETRYSRIYNSVFWGNAVGSNRNQIEGASQFLYCAVEGGFDGTSMISLSHENDGEAAQNYPRFANPSNGDYSIDKNSVCVDAGDKTVTGVAGPDILGNQRIVNEQIDLGAIECQIIDAVDDVEVASFKLYPNPVDDKLVVVKEGTIILEVYNAMGQKMVSVEAIDETAINTSDWDSGIYLVTVNGVARTIVK